ncbi:hypothetical protein CAJAP_02701 [Camponotus japonicus]
MDAADLGARCIDYLSEWDRQRRICSNISGSVASRMKDCMYIVTEMTRAFTSKLTSLGDPVVLKQENYATNRVK